MKAFKPAPVANPQRIRDDTPDGTETGPRGGDMTESVSAAAVFISYASQDVEAARQVCDALRAVGIEVWLDQSELRGGDVWDRQIRQQIHDCRLFVPIVSANTEARVEGYFRREWKLAVDRTQDLSERVAFLVPIVIDSTPEVKADVPEAFRHVQWTRLPGGHASLAFVERVRRLVAPVPAPALSASTGTLAHRSAPPSTPPIGTHRVTRAARWALWLLVALGLAYFAAHGLWPSSRVPAAGPVAAAPPAPMVAMTTIPEKSVAVLPFIDMSEKKDQEYFVDGLSEELIDMLTKVPELRVPARTSAFYFKGKQATIPEIAKALGVADVLEGSVRKSGQHMRITAQLIRADNGYHLWSETYDRQLDDIFKVQDEIAGAVVKALKASLLESGVQNAKATQNTGAYTAYLQGRALYAQAFNDETLEICIKYLREATRLDPAFADAWAALAIALQWASRESQLPGHTALLAEARRAAEHAVSLNPGLGEAHRALGSVYGSEWDWTHSMVEYQKAYELSPDDSDTARNLAELTFMLHVDDVAARRLFEKSISEDPLSTWNYLSLAMTEFELGEYREAEAAARKANDLTGNVSHDLLAMIFLESGRTAAALSECTQVTQTSSRSACMALAQHALGREAESAEWLGQLERTGSASDAFLIAEVHAYRGEVEPAINWLDRAYVQGISTLRETNRDPLLRNLRGDPRFKAILRKMNLPE